METFKITGQLNGWLVTYERSNEPDPTTGAYEDFDLPGALSYLKTLGLEPTGAPMAPQAAPPPQQQGSFRDRVYGQPQQPQQGGGWSCPTHGPANVGPGYQGRGFECKVTSVGRVPPWGWRPGKDKNTGYPLQYTFCNRDGQYVYACKERSA